MSRLSKYVKEKLVKVLVTALVVGSVAGNGTVTVQAVEKNINTKAFLGEAYNYGIVARTYVQSNHMQSNFAVINYNLTQKTECGDNITDRENKDIVFGNSMTESGNANEYRYTLDNGSVFELNSGKGCRENTKIYSGGETPNGNSIEDYIGGMIQYATGKSQEAKDLNDTEGVWQDGKYIIDVTEKSGTTFYVNVTNILNNLNGDVGKLTINANAGQTVVLNDLSDKIELHRSTINGKQWETSDEMANRADKVIYNFPDATEVYVSESIMGAIVAPNAKVTVASTSALWIVADYVTNTRGEIHRAKEATDEPTPTVAPTTEPTQVPTTEPTVAPTTEPTQVPTTEPTVAPTTEPTQEPTVAPTTEPTQEPTVAPTTEPTQEPTVAPTAEPTQEPTVAPTTEPTQEPTVAPTQEPTVAPTTEPTQAPTTEPTVAPTTEPTQAPTTEPTVEPTTEPTVAPTTEPTQVPTTEPTVAPTTEPTQAPTTEPTVAPTTEPTQAPTQEPTAEPTQMPTTVPTATPSTTPDNTPTPTPNTPDTPDDPDTPDTPVTPTDPGTPVDPVTPENPQVLGARRRRVVTITDDPVPLADRAVLGASRRPQTSDDSDAWNLGFLLSLTGLGAWLIIKRKE